MTITEDELNESDYEIEDYCGGFIIADYSEKSPTPHGVRYRGQRLNWEMQRIIPPDEVFPTKEKAMQAIDKDGTGIDMKEYDALLEDLL